MTKQELIHNVTLKVQQIEIKCKNEESYLGYLTFESQTQLHNVREYLRFIYKITAGSF